MTDDGRSVVYRSFTAHDFRGLCSDGFQGIWLPVRFRHKFNAQRTEVDGIKFASKREAKYYGDLVQAKRAGNLLFFLRQVPFHLTADVKYVCDFVEFWRDGDVRFVDVKGFKTPVYRLKIRQVMALYPIEITEV